MNTTIIDTLKERPIVIPRILFKNYKKLNITEEELIVLIFILNLGEKIVYNLEIFIKELNYDKYQIMRVLTNLSEKNIISIRVEKNSQGISEEYICTDILYNKIFNLLLDKEDQKEKTIDTDLFTLFEQELGRTLSPMECEIIKEWINSSNYSEELIREALKEAIYNNVRSLKYIDRILYTWNTKGIKNKADIIKDKSSYRKSTTINSDVFDYNWLEEEWND